MARKKKTNRLRASLKARHRRKRARRCGLLKKTKAGGRLKRVPTGKAAEMVYI